MKVENLHSASLLTLKAQIEMRTNATLEWPLVSGLLPNNHIISMIQEIDDLEEAERNYQIIMAVKKVEVVSIILPTPLSFEVITYDRKGTVMGDSFTTDPFARSLPIEGLAFFNDLFAITHVTQEMIDLVPSFKDWYCDE